jgi:hypothetical protein
VPSQVPKNVFIKMQIFVISRSGTLQYVDIKISTLMLRQNATSKKFVRKKLPNFFAVTFCQSGLLFINLLERN